MKLINNNSSLLYTQIKLKAKQANLTMKELCKRSGVSQNTLSSWKHENPRTIETLIKLENTLNKFDGGFYCMSDGEKCARQCTHCKRLK